MVLLPPPLPPGGTVALISPARFAPSHYLTSVTAFFQAEGYKVLCHPQTGLRWGRMAGDDKARAQALMDVFADPAVDAVFCASGGVGSVRLLDLLDYSLIAQHPKPLIGFSDVTALLQAIARRSGIMTFHGPMGWNLAQGDNDPRTNTDLLAMLRNPVTAIERDFKNIKILREGSAVGTLYGGNLHVLSYLSGTPYDWPSNEDIILFFEDVDEPLYKIDMRLRHLRLSGRLGNVKAVIVGEMVKISDGENNQDQLPYGPSLDDILLDNFSETIPIGCQFPCGHGNYLTTLPIGEKVKIKMEASQINFVPYTK